MRHLTVLALALTACGSDDTRGDTGSASSIGGNPGAGGNDTGPLGDAGRIYCFATTE